MDLSSCLFSLLCLSTVLAELQLAVVSPKTAILESDTLLECTFTVGTSRVDFQYLTITWRFKGRELLKFEDRLEVFDSRVSIDEAKIADGNASLKLSELMTSHEGEYTCSVIYSPDRREKTITLILQARPRIIIQEPAVIKGKENLLRCSVVGFYPMEISVFWSKDGQILPGSSMSQHQRHTNGTFMINSTLPIIPTDSDANHTFSCHVRHSSLEGPLQEDVMLLLQVAELQLAVVSPKTAILGSDTLLECTFTVDTSRMDFQYLAITWSFKGRELLRYKDRLEVFDSRVSIDEAKIADGNASLQLSELMTSHEGEYTCSVIYSSDRIEKTITLILQARPRIIIQEPAVIKGKENLLRCSVVGFYPMEISVFWSRDGQVLPGSSMSQHQRHTNGTFMINSTLSITPTDSDANHTFSCHVRHSSLEGPLQEDVMLLLQEEERSGRVMVVVLSLLVIVVIVAVLGWFLYRRLEKPQVCGNITCFPCDGLNVKCALDLKQFYPKEIQIKWSCGSGKLEDAPSEESETENADRRTFNIRTECIVPEEAFNDVNFRIRVTWDHASLKAPEYREMSVTDPDFPGRPRLDDIVVPPLLHGFEASLQCRVAEYFPKELQVEWLKVEKASNGHFPQYDGGNENVLQSDGGYEPLPPSDGIYVPNFEVDGTDVPCSSSDESDDDVSQTNESKRLVPQSDGSDGLVSQSTGNDGHHPQINGCDERVNQINISDDPVSQSNRNDGHVPQSDGSVTLSNGINGSVPQCDGSDVPVPPSDACLSVDLLSNDLSCGKQECINITHEPGKGYSCTARLTFTTDLCRHQGSEFICRVSHPSLKETLEKSTGKLIVLSEPKVNVLKIESFRGDEIRTLLLDVYGFYPGKVTVLWTCDTQGERTGLLSALNVTEEGDGTYSAQSTCQFTRKERQKFGETPTITLTIEHEALREPLTATITLGNKGNHWTLVSQNFSWAPKSSLPSTG